MISHIWSARDRAPLVYYAFEEVYRMLTRAERMFESAVSLLFDPEPGAAAKADAAPVDVADLDEDIDYGERVVRRLVFQHLSMNPKQDLTASLILVSIVHDVERTGDYVKSLSYLSRWGAESNEHGRRSREIADRIRPMFGETLQALREGDEDAARSVMDRHRTIKTETNAFLQEMLKGGASPDSIQGAMVWSICVQYLRRISSHLGNVASSVANPFDRLGAEST